MDAELWKTIFGSAGVVTVLGGIIAGIIKLYQHRQRSRREDDLDDRDWVVTYRSYGEEHLIWDNDRRSDIFMLRNVVNEMRSKLNMPPISWPAIPLAPRLFPRAKTSQSPPDTEAPE